MPRTVAATAPRPGKRNTSRRRAYGTAPSNAADLDDSAIVSVPGYGTLTEKQKRFAEAYRNHGNAARAAREAGYGASSDDNFADIGLQLRRNPRVVWYLAFLGRDDDLQPGDVLDRLRDLSASADHAGAAVRATELLGKARGMFAEDINLHVSRAPDEAIADAIAGDDQELKARILGKLRGE